jgi:hypothetical protein
MIAGLVVAFESVRRSRPFDESGPRATKIKLFDVI